MSDSDFSRDPSPASGGSPSPPPPSANQQLAYELSCKSGKYVFEHCLGLSKLKGVSSAAENLIVICFDTENWSHNANAITEVGIATFDSRDMRAVKEVGQFGGNLLEQVYFYHARIVENAHLINIKFCVGNPDSNRFGQTRFVTKAQACKLLTQVFAWPIDAAKPELGFCPVVVMGHALHGDTAMLRRTLGFDSAPLDTVVKTIDTQHLAKECGYAPRGGNMIGLSNLVRNIGFEYRDAHTASNDAAMTLICAVQMVLPQQLKKPVNGDTLQAIIDNIEVARKQQDWSWGSDKYCLRCGEWGHTMLHYANGRRCYAKVKCDHCASSKVDKRRKAAASHRTECCITFAMHGPEDGVDDLSAGIARLGLRHY